MNESEHLILIELLVKTNAIYNILIKKGIIQDLELQQEMDQIAKQLVKQIKDTEKKEISGEVVEGVIIEDNGSNAHVS